MALKIQKITASFFVILLYNIEIVSGIHLDIDLSTKQQKVRRGYEQEISTNEIRILNNNEIKTLVDNSFDMQYFDKSKTDNIPGKKIIGSLLNFNIVKEGKVLNTLENSQHGSTEKKSKEIFKCNSSHCNLKPLFNSKAVEDRERKMNDLGFVRNIEGRILDREGHISKTNKISKIASSSFNSLSFKENFRCQSSNLLFKIPKKEQSCKQYYDIVHSNCYADQGIKIDLTYLYQCYKKIDIKNKVCNEYVSTECNSLNNCFELNASIVKVSKKTDINWKYIYPYLKISSNSYILSPFSYNSNHKYLECGSKNCCSKKYIKIDLKIEDLKTIKKFILHKISYDDHLLIRINNTLVYSSLGGNYLEITSKYLGSHREGDNDRLVSSGSSMEPCWKLYPKNGFYYYNYIDKDIKHLLLEGINSIEMEIVFAQIGQLDAVFKLEQYCCKKWIDSIKTICQYLG